MEKFQKAGIRVEKQNSFRNNVPERINTNFNRLFWTAGRKEDRQ